jgi:hypothetical protein
VTRAESGAGRYSPGDLYMDRLGNTYRITTFHLYRGALVLCPVCDCGPCAPDCAEQRIPPPAPRPRPAPLTSNTPASPPIGRIGTGNPQDLVQAAFAEARRLREIEREEAASGVAE